MILEQELIHQEGDVVANGDVMCNMYGSLGCA